MTAFVATLIARPGRAADLERLAAEAARALGSEPADWLASGAAVDLRFEGPDAAASRTALERLVGDAPIDAVVQPLAHRRKKLLLADMDSTIIGQECIDELADFAGIKPQIAAITERAMRGEIAFEPALRERVALLAGLPESTIATVLAERIRLNPGAKALVATMRANGARTALVSGGFTAFTEKVAAMTGFDETRANRLIVEGGRLAGRVEEPILGRDAKRESLERLVGELGIGFEDSMAIGDGANDLAMLARAGLGVAFHAKPKVAEAAAARLDHTDLTSLLYIQGYRETDFVGG